MHIYCHCGKYHASSLSFTLPTFFHIQFQVGFFLSVSDSDLSIFFGFIFFSGENVLRFSSFRAPLTGPLLQKKATLASETNGEGEPFDSSFMRDCFKPPF